MKKDWQRKMIDTKTVLSACDRFHSQKDSRSPLEIIMDETGAPEKVVWLAMEREYDKGLIECGVSIRCAWLTDKGKLLLHES